MTNLVKIKIIGKNPDYFLKTLIYERINLYSLEKEKNDLQVIINEKDYEKIKKRKTTYKIIIIKRYGPHKYLYYIKNHFPILLFVVLGIILNIILSHLIFAIEFVHPNKQLISIIRKDLQEYGLKKYALKISVEKKERIKQKVLEKEKDLLEWIEITEEGTTYKITLEERKKNPEEEKCIPRNIIAKKNAMILEIQSSSGEIVRKKYDYVEKGEILISGLIHNKEEVVSQKCAIGTVYGETWYKVTVLLPKKEKITSLTGKRQLGLSLIFLNDDFSTYRKFSTFQKKEYNIVEGSIIPIKIGLIQYLESQGNYKVYKKVDLEKQALEIASNAINKKLQKEEKVLEKKVLKMTAKNSKIEIEVFLKVKENITDYRNIEE